MKDKEILPNIILEWYDIIKSAKRWLHVILNSVSREEV